MHTTVKKIALWGLMLGLLSLAACFANRPSNDINIPITEPEAYSGTTAQNSSIYPVVALFSAPAPTLSSVTPDALGFAVGGANDVQTLRSNIVAGYLPQISDLTLEGLFYDYYFDTAASAPCQALFCPSYSYARVNNPLTGEEGHYLQVGLNSNLRVADFTRPKLNLVVVVDVSGSMSSPVGGYYYGSGGNTQSSESDLKTKHRLTKEAIATILSQLGDEDRFGLVTFSSYANLVSPLRTVEGLDESILGYGVGGGTNMHAGIELGTGLYGEYLGAGDYANRMIVITDAMPNQGFTSVESFKSLLDQNADSGLHTTFVGVGLDFNSGLAEAISSVQGANYVSITSSEDFSQRLGEEFGYIVSPLVYDLKLTLDSEGFEIEKVYGSPQADAATGELLSINTLFPSPTRDGQTKGGVVILKLRPTADDRMATLTASYKDGQGEAGGETQLVEFVESEIGSYPNNGIRKAVLLVNYAELLAGWLASENAFYADPEELYSAAWERGPTPLTVNPEYKTKFTTFKTHLEAEIELLDDPDLQQEVDLLQRLIDVPDSVAEGK